MSDHMTSIPTFYRGNGQLSVFKPLLNETPGHCSALRLALPFLKMFLPFPVQAFLTR